MENINIRKMTVNDVDVLYKIESQCFSDPWSKNQFSMIPSLNYAHFYVLEFEGVIVGFAGIYVTDVTELMNIAVLPRFRRMRFALLLLDECIKKARQFNTERILLEVRRSNEAAISLYKKRQFFNIGIRRNYYKAPVEDAIVMMKDLKNEYTCF